MGTDSTPSHWDDYTNLQHTKHALIREYLNGWYPKLGLWSGRIVYLDTHAGRGEFKKGQSGSPVVALETLLAHSFRDRILQNSEAQFVFIEHDIENVNSLNKRIEALGKLPSRIHVAVTEGDCYTQLEGLLSELEKNGQKMAPAFIFVDPYGFKVPGDLLARLAAAGHVELFVNVIWRELDMAIAIAQAEPSGGMAATLNGVFGSDCWMQLNRELPINDRADQTIDLLRNVYGVQWATSIKMLGANNATRYMLAHFTNHDGGRDLMKDCIWKVCPDGGYYARRSDNPSQSQLIVPEPNLAPLKEWLVDKLSDKPWRWSELRNAIRGELWRHTHLSGVIRDCRNKGIIVASDYVGRFSEKANPVFALPE